MKPLSFKHSSRFLLRLVVAVLFLLPLVWMIFTALYPPGIPLPTSLRLLPEQPTLRNFSRIFEWVPLGRYTLNSLLVAGLGVLLTVTTGSWAGLGMARLSSKWQQRWVIISLAVLMVPGIALWSTRFFIYERLGLIDTYAALLAPAVMGTSPFYVLMFYRAFRRIPAALYDAAHLDGTGVLQLWWHVALPIARPTLVGVSVLAFLFYWADFISPLLYMSDPDLLTLPVALQLFQQLSRSEWALLMAAATWATLVPLLLFIFIQPYFARVSEPEKKQKKEKHS